MQFQQLDLSTIQLGSLQAGKGCKTASAQCNGAPLKFLLSPDEWFACPFGASAYQDEKATRLTLEMDVTGKKVYALLQNLDKWAVNYVIGHQVFGDMSPDDVAKQYHPCLQFSEKYSSHRLRTKINTAGMNSCKWFRHPEKESVPFEQLDLRQSQIQPVIHLKGLWKQSTQWGLSMDVVKALVDSQGNDEWEF